MTLDVLQLSADERFVEVWHNGNRVHTVPVAGGLNKAVGLARDYCREWSGGEPVYSRTLKDRLGRIDATFCRLAFGEEYR